MKHGAGAAIAALCLLLSAGSATAQHCSVNDPTRFSIHSDCPQPGEGNPWDIHPPPGWKQGDPITGVSRQNEAAVKACARLLGDQLLDVGREPIPPFRPYCIGKVPRRYAVPLD